MMKEVLEEAGVQNIGLRRPAAVEVFGCIVLNEDYIMKRIPPPIS